MRRILIFGAASLVVVAVVAGVAVFLAVDAETTASIQASTISSAPSAAVSQTTVTADTGATTTTSQRLTMNIMSSVDKNAVTPEFQMRYAEIVIYGTIVKIDPGRRNSPDGKQWIPAKETDLPVIYTTFYVVPIKMLKGEPRFGTPVAFMFTGGTEGIAAGPVGVGEKVVVFGRYDQKLYGDVYWNKEAYFPRTREYSIYVEDASGTLTNLGDPYRAEMNGLTVEQLSGLLAKSE